MKSRKDKPIGLIVAENLAAAPVFERYGLDFCCHGDRTLDAACREHGIAADRIEAELDALERPAEANRPDAAAMAVDELARYIVATHHVFTKEALRTISAHFETVVRVHGARHPGLTGLHEAFAGLRDELELHLAKEEEVLFPYLEALVEAQRDRTPLPHACFAEVSQPIAMMEREHEEAGAVLDRMHDSTGGFEPPPDACNTYRLLFRELAGLEQDLHRHIALENYLLFPKSVELEQRLRKR